MTELPQDVFADLSQLEFLVLAVNELTELPADAFSALAGLRTLYLLENRLSRLPEGIFTGLSGLEGLYLRDNRLSELPEGVSSALPLSRGLSLENNPGAPFVLTLRVERQDSEDLLAPSPGTVGVALAEGAPFAMQIPLWVHGGGPPARWRCSGRGMEGAPGSPSPEATATGRAPQVSAGSGAPGFRFGVTGIRLVPTDPPDSVRDGVQPGPGSAGPAPWYRLRGGRPRRRSTCLRNSGIPMATS